MRRAVLVVCVLGLPLVALAQTRVVGERPDCVHATAIARYGAMAYDHWVHVENTCPNTVRCTVHTDVNPTPTSIELEAGQSRDVATFHGSPATAFVATVECR